MSYLLLQASANALPLADESVQMCVTSPPYWGLRTYQGEQSARWADGTCHPLGLEPTPELYVAHMVEVFRDVRRVLRSDGVLWLNLGDSYAGSWGAQGRTGQMADRSVISARQIEAHPKRLSRTGSIPEGSDLKPKDLVGIPWMVAFALRAGGWYLRSDIVWHKPNPMPESVTDRPTKAHEYVFLMSKSERYFYDADAIREAHSRDWSGGRSGGSLGPNGAKKMAPAAADPNFRNGHSQWERDEYPEPNPSGRNKRDVWTIATVPYPGAHFATFPEALVEPCILAGSSPQACGECGAPWERVTEAPTNGTANASASEGSVKAAIKPTYGQGRRGAGTSMSNDPRKRIAGGGATVGWKPTCEHDDGSGQSVVLDPFSGSGTAGRVAMRHGRSYVGVDISREYLDEQALRRIDPLAAQRRDVGRTGQGQAVLL